jgi:hypothetical protein
MFGIITWISTKLGISTLVVQLILVSVCCGGAFWWLKHHDAVLYEKTYKEAKADGIEEQRKINEKNWTALLEKIKIEHETYANTINELKVLNEQIANSRDSWVKKYELAKADVHTQIVEIPKIVEKVPKSDLVDSIRVASGAIVQPTPITNIEKTGVFTEVEERLVLSQILELPIRRNESIKYETLIEEDKVNDKKAQESFTLSLNNERANASTIAKERDLALEKVKFFEASYDSCRKKRSKKCWFAKIFTFGLAKCI